jgi:hypothetical protein
VATSVIEKVTMPMTRCLALHGFVLALADDDDDDDGAALVAACVGLGVALGAVVAPELLHAVAATEMAAIAPRNLKDKRICLQPLSTQPGGKSAPVTFRSPPHRLASAKLDTDCRSDRSANRAKSHSFEKVALICTVAYYPRR